MIKEGEDVRKCRIAEWISARFRSLGFGPQRPPPPVSAVKVCFSRFMGRHNMGPVQHWPVNAHTDIWTHKKTHLRIASQSVSQATHSYSHFLTIHSFRALSPNQDGVYVCALLMSNLTTGIHKKCADSGVHLHTSYLFSYFWFHFSNLSPLFCTFFSFQNFPFNAFSLLTITEMLSLPMQYFKHCRR